MSRLVVEADGGSRGNPGPAGYGALVRDAGSGDLLAEVAESIGTATNNVAEYRGLVAGLEAAAELCGGQRPADGTELEVRMDSKLVVEQMSGRWKIKHADLQPLARRAARLAEPFAAVSYQWIPRARNAHADRLANEAMDAAAEGRTWSRHETARPEAAAAPPGAETDSRVEGSARTTGQLPSASGWMAPTTSPTTTVLLRHGETPLSGEKRFSGLGEVELTPHGKKQAIAAAERMRSRGDIDAIVTSPLTRTRETADVLAKVLDVPVVEDDRLRETDFGEWERLTFGEVRRQWPEALAAWLDDSQVAPPEGESFAATTDRVCRARDAMMEHYPGQTVLVVTHVTPIKTLVREALLAPPAALYRMHLDVACVCEIDWYADGPAVVRSMNDTSHLA